MSDFVTFCKKLSNVNALKIKGKHSLMRGRLVFRTIHLQDVSRPDDRK